MSSRNYLVYNKQSLKYMHMYYETMRYLKSAFWQDHFTKFVCANKTVQSQKKTSKFILIKITYFLGLKADGDDPIAVSLFSEIFDFIIFCNHK